MWKELLDPYEQAVSELLVKFRNLKEEHRKKNLYSPIESVCGRVKSVASILDKMQRKNISFEDMEEEVEDIAGVRIICQFVEDIETVANLIYKRTDMEVRSKKDYLTNKKASGYRSFHLIVWYTVQTVSGPKRLQVEIQIRTMAMNFWATTEHSLQYKYRGQIPEHVAERLAASADQRFRQTEVELVQSILTSIENLYRVESEREVRKIQDEFYRIYSLHNIDELDRFAKQLDILAEGAGAQSVDSSIRS